MLTLGSPIRCCLAMLAIAALTPALTGCSGPATPRPSSTVSGTALERLDRFDIDREVLKGLGYRVDWRSAPPVGADPTLSSVDPFDDIVVVQTKDTLLSVLDSDTGAVRHANELNDTITTLTGNLRLGSAVVSCTDGEAFFIDPVSGDLIDRQAFDGVLASSPVAVAGLLMAATNEGIVLAHTPANGGFPLWRFATRNPVDARVALSGSNVTVITRSGRLVALEAATGLMTGENSIFMGPEGTDPVASDSTVYVASPDQSVYAFDSFDLTLRWRYRTSEPLTQQIALVDSVLYVPTRSKGLVALDAATGAELWTAPEVLGEVVTVQSDRLLVFAGGRAWSVNRSDGALLGAYDLPNIAAMKADTVDAGDVYAVSKDHIVARFVARR